MPLAVVQTVDTELLCVFYLIVPQQLDVACRTAVLLFVPELQDGVNFQIELTLLGSVLAFVSSEFLCDLGSELLIAQWLSDLGSLSLRKDNPFKLLQVLHAGNRQVNKVGPLEVVIYDPDLLGTFDGQTLRAMNCKGITEAPISEQMEPSEHCPLGGLD